MKNIDTILEEFDNQFGTTLWANRRGDDEDAKDFIRTAFAEYKMGLREAVEGMKVEHHHVETNYDQVLKNLKRLAGNCVPSNTSQINLFDSNRVANLLDYIESL